LNYKPAAQSSRGCVSGPGRLPLSGSPLEPRGANWAKSAVIPQLE